MSLLPEEVMGCTMIALDQPPFWPESSEGMFIFTITVDGSSLRPMTVEFPSTNRSSIFVSFSGVIVWGDGNTEEIEYSSFRNISHTYLSSGTYQIKFKGHYYYSNSQIENSYHRLLLKPDHLDSIDSKFPKPEIPVDVYREGSYIIEWQPRDENASSLFNGAFDGCHNLKTIPSGLFANHPHVMSAEWMFHDCYVLQYIPSDLFINFNEVSIFKSTFAGCRSLTFIPENLFSSCEKATTFYGCFSSCHSLESIPSELFKNCPLVTNFEFTFSSCRSLESIPSQLFDNCPLVTNFIECFAGCLALLSIPSELFDDCPLVTDFNGCFADCDSLTYIPYGLFANCKKVLSFNGCFLRCSSLLSIPSQLFDNCPLVTDFRSCFERCISLTFVPSSLFDFCRLANNFQSCFINCSSIVSFVPELWITHPDAFGIACYRECRNALNYEDIPNTWR